MRHAFTILSYYPQHQMLHAEATFIDEDRHAALYAEELAHDFAGINGRVEKYTSRSSNNAYIAENVHGEQRIFYLTVSPIL